jgi:hypothetical protein
MTKRRSILLYLTYCAIAAVLFFAVLPKAHGAAQDFRLVNRTGLTIRRVYITPHRSERWGEDVLGRDVLEEGESVTIRFPRGERVAHWDLKVVERGGKSLTWDNLNLLDISEVILRYRGGRTFADFK